MAPFRGRRGGRGGRGASGGRGGHTNGKLARSGIRTRAGYRRFDSQRVKEVEPAESDDVQSEPEDVAEENDDLSSEEDVEEEKGTNAYNALLQTFNQPNGQRDRPRKRRKIEVDVEEDPLEEMDDSDDSSGVEAEDEFEAQALEGDDDVDAGQSEDEDDKDEADDAADPFEIHFADPEDNELSRRLKSVQSNEWRTERQTLPGIGQMTVSAPQGIDGSLTRKGTIKSTKDVALKKRLDCAAQTTLGDLDTIQQSLAPYIFHYTDVMLGNRTPHNARSLRELVSLHAVNHILKGRDKVIKNNARLSRSENANLDLRDQGFTRPKVLLLLETRQMCVKYVESIVALFGPQQQENKQRLESSFSAPIENRDGAPEDFRELFEGNNDNNFITGLKFTRKTLKFYAPFYTSDIILASPLGLRRILENEDVKKRDHDFLSSIEIVIADQADAMQMQNWENVECVFRHLNLPLKEAHGCDFSRVRSWYLDGHASHLRHTIVFSAYLTPEMNRLFNSSISNIAGKVKLVPAYPDGAISSVGGLGIKQTFSRFDAPSPAAGPDARFKYFTSTTLPALLRSPTPADGAKGILIFIPSYYDFLRVRNFFATSTTTQHVSFGAIHDYSDVAGQRRARSHLLSGRHAVLLYTQRAHHFYRLRIRGVKKVVMYGVPDNAMFYEELTMGFLGTSLEEGRVAPGEARVRAMFSKWDGLRMERIVGSARVKGMLGGKGDTFDFV